MLKQIENNLREFVYGGIDGAVTTFAVVMGAAGGGLSNKVILILGFANVFADGFSMAVGAYLSEKSEQELAIGKGGVRKKSNPLQAALATFTAFILIGFIPLAVYTIDYALGLNYEYTLQLSVVLTLLTFAGIGYLRGQVTQVKRKRAIIETLGLGAVAAIISYCVGDLLEKIIT